MAVKTRPGRHARRDEHEEEQAAMRELEEQAAARYRKMIGADDSLTEAGKRARRNAEQTPLRDTNPW